MPEYKKQRQHDDGDLFCPERDPGNLESIAAIPFIVGGSLAGIPCLVAGGFRYVINRITQSGHHRPSEEQRKRVYEDEIIPGHDF